LAEKTNPFEPAHQSGGGLSFLELPMSKSITAALVLGAVTLAAGVVPGNFLVVLSKADGTEVTRHEGTDAVVTFAAVEAGDYVLTASRLGADGVELSAPVTTAVTIPTDVVSADVPVSITVSLA
jgi:hypothetical protein